MGARPRGEGLKGGSGFIEYKISATYATPGTIMTHKE